MKIEEQIQHLMDEHSARVRAARKARLTRISKEVAEQNEGLEPKLGRGGRFHAPCDGYQYDDGQRDGTYMKGEFLPIPIDDDDDRDIGEKSFAERETLRITYVSAERARVLADSDVVDGFDGRPFDRHGIDTCHFYLKGRALRSQAVVELITEWLREPLKIAEERAEARTAAERAAAEPVPETDKRIAITGTVLTLKTEKGWGYYDWDVKMLVKDDRGFKLWGKVPASIEEDLETGDRITFMAAVERSRDDEKFGFFKRPTKAAINAEESAA